MIYKFFATTFLFVWVFLINLGPSLATPNTDISIKDIEKNLDRLEDKGLISFDEANKLRDELKNTSNNSAEKLAQIMSKINENQSKLKLRKENEVKQQKEEEKENNKMQMQKDSSVTGGIISNVKKYAGEVKQYVQNIVSSSDTKDTNKKNVGASVSGCDGCNEKNTQANPSQQNPSQTIDKKTIIKVMGKITSKIDGLESADLDAIEKNAKKKQQELDSIDENEGKPAKK
ncbi:MAG: hypothetical protein HQK49_09935 [Oligoflexia bacterium]|nr:hypothetical protein [Oligoflexia bacterium]